jgi:hypothetical protein
MVVERLNDEMLKEARKNAIRDYDGIKFVITTSSCARALNSIASSNLVIAEVLTRGLEDSHKEESHQCQCSHHDQENENPVITPYLAKTILGTLDLADSIIKSGQNAPPNHVILYGMQSQEIRTALEKFANTDFGSENP